MKIFYYFVLLTLMVTVFISGIQAQTTVLLLASKDNSIFSESTNSNALGDLFVGMTNTQNRLRRALVQFSTTSLIPTNATITAVTLTLTKNKGGSGNTSLHRLTSDWGEGTSFAGGGGPGSGGGDGAAPSPGDATWQHTFYNTQFWASNGGDYVSGASATVNVTSNGLYNWSTPNMVSDVQGWVNDTTTNFGWIIIGDESTNSSASRFNSSEDGTGFPLLTVEFTTPPICLDTLMRSGTLLPGTYQAAKLIQSNGTVDSPDNVIFDTGIEAILEENFTTILGATFEIKIGGCTN